MTRHDTSFIGSLAVREQFRDRYLEYDDPIAGHRMLWQARTFRYYSAPPAWADHSGAGLRSGDVNRQLARFSRGENSITAVTFVSETKRPADLLAQVAFLNVSSLPGPLGKRRFDFIVAMDLLDRDNCASVLQNVYEFLKPGGEVLFYERNPWNAVLKLCRSLSGSFGCRDPRSLLSRPQLYELMSEVAVTRQFPEEIQGQGLSLMSDNGCQPTSLTFMKACATLGGMQAFNNDC